MRITGNDKDGQDQLGKTSIDPGNRSIQCSFTTSRLPVPPASMHRPCRLIVLEPRGVGLDDRRIQAESSDAGTRVHEDTKKFYFTIESTSGARRSISPDPDFRRGAGADLRTGCDDPDHSSRMDVPADRAMTANTLPDVPGADENHCRWPAPTSPLAASSAVGMRKVYVDGRRRHRSSPKRVEYLDEDGKPRQTEFLARLHQEGTEEGAFASLDDFLKNVWNDAERKASDCPRKLEAEGLPASIPIAQELGKDLDPFDLNFLPYIAFDRKSRSRRREPGAEERQETRCPFAK